MADHLTMKELADGLPHVRQSPKDEGVLRAIVIRPATDERVSLNECDISPELGVHGDNWAKQCWSSLPDGRPNPDVQVAITNARLIDLIAKQPERWPLAGDNLYVDLDLSEENLLPGERIEIGTSVLEITAQPHTGCKKFALRYGTDAIKLVNSDGGKLLRLRGIYAKIVEAGTIHVGDMIKKVE